MTNASQTDFPKAGSPETAALLAALAATLERNTQVVLKNTDGVTHEASLRPVAPGSSHLNWLIGHMVASRDGILAQLGAETTWERERARRYDRGSQLPARGEEEPLSELLAALERSQRLLAAALPAAPAERLAAPSGMPGRSVLEWTEFLVWHDSYHTGQTALYRRVAGLEGTLG